MIIAIILLVIYGLVIIGSIAGIVYFIIKRQAEKKVEKEILDKDDY